MEQEERAGERVVARLSEAARTVGVAESCTGGLLSARLAGVAGSGSVFVGGVVTYATRLKHDLLDVDAGRVVTEAAARQMATGARRLLDSDVGVAITGSLGPQPQEGQPPGTVYVAVDVLGQVRSARLTLEPCDPDELREQAAEATLEFLDQVTADVLRR